MALYVLDRDCILNHRRDSGEEACARFGLLRKEPIERLVIRTKTQRALRKYTQNCLSVDTTVRPSRLNVV